MPPDPLSDVTVVWSDELRRTEPLVSVCVVTYNQEEYIEDALDSVLKQEVDFGYELIVGDDYSTDDTRQILREYQQAHSDRIRLNLHDEHYDGIPGRKNMVANLESARGRYVALLDGDDYWVSTDKLQRQATALNARSTLSFSFHDAYVAESILESTSLKKNGRGYLASDRYPEVLGEDRLFQLEDFVNWQHDGSAFIVPASSIMFRRHLFTPVPRWFWDVWNADKAMQLQFANYGPALYLNKLKSFYRWKNPRSMGALFDDSLERNRHRIDQLSTFCAITPAYKEHRWWELYKRYRTRTRLLLNAGKPLRAFRSFVLGVAYLLIYALYYVFR